jgi:hypothetical protein
MVNLEGQSGPTIPAIAARVGVAPKHSATPIIPRETMEPGVAYRRHRLGHSEGNGSEGENSSPVDRRRREAGPEGGVVGGPDPVSFGLDRTEAGPHVARRCEPGPAIRA